MAKGNAEEAARSLRAQGYRVTGQTIRNVDRWYEANRPAPPVLRQGAQIERQSEPAESDLLDCGELLTLDHDIMRRQNVRPIERVRDPIHPDRHGGRVTRYEHQSHIQTRLAADLLIDNFLLILAWSGIGSLVFFAQLGPQPAAVAYVAVCMLMIAAGKEQRMRRIDP